MNNKTIISNDSLGDRIKTFENISRFYLDYKVPFVIRFDGKAFHTFTRKFEKPYSVFLHDLMINTTKKLMEEIPNSVFGYTQSDEISILCQPYVNLNSQAWFSGNINKINSIGASIASVFFNKEYHKKANALNIDLDKYNPDEIILFDSRTFNLPEHEMFNYFYWRQADWKRNSVQMFARYHFSQKQLNNLNQKEMKDKLLKEKNLDYEKEVTGWKRYGSMFFEKDLNDIDLLENRKKFEEVYLTYKERQKNESI